MGIDFGTSVWIGPPGLLESDSDPLDSIPSAWISLIISPEPTSSKDDSDPTVWQLTTVFSLPTVSNPLDSDPTLWMITYLDEEPTIYEFNSDPTVWLATIINPEVPATQDSEPSGWLIVVIDDVDYPTGMFIVTTSDTLVQITILD